MPTYLFRCECGARYERVLSMKEHVNKIECTCGKLANQVISVPQVIIPAHMRFDYGSFKSPVSGNIIRNKQEHINDMAANGCEMYDPEIRKDVERKQMEDDMKLDKLCEETVEREYEVMPEHKREMLAKELVSSNVEIIKQ